MKEREKHPNSLLKRERELRGWSQQKVAERLGTSEQVVNRWENGQHKPNRYFQTQLCELFGKSAEELGFMNKQTVARVEEETQKQHVIQNSEQLERSSYPSQAIVMKSAEELEAENVSRYFMPTRREILEFVGATTASFAASEVFGTDILHEFACVLNKPSVLEEHHLSLLEERAVQLWKYRDDGILLPHELYAAVERHCQQVIRLLDGSLLPTMRTRLLTIASKMVVLNGALLYDVGRHEQAREYQRFAIQAAAQATQPILQAIAYAWMSFSWTYERQYLEASNAITQALTILTDLNEDRGTFAWLTAVAAEISANLGKYDESCSFLEQAESSLGSSIDQRHVYLHQFSNAQFRGFRGVCYQALYHPKKPETHGLLDQARDALEQALLDSSASIRQKQLYLADLASVYARRGEVEMACTLTKQTVDLMHLAMPKNVLQRMTEIQQLLWPWKETKYVKDLNDFFRVVGII